MDKIEEIIQKAVDDAVKLGQKYGSPELQAKYDTLQAREKRSSDCIIWHSKELSKVKRDNLRLREKLEYMKKYSGYIRPDGHPHIHYHGGCIWCDIDQAIAEAKEI